MEKRDIVFMGKITAGITHEMNNILAIIRESGGLLEDILALPAGKDFPYRDKFDTGLTRIREQVARGVELSRRLNRFAHSMDEPVLDLDLGDLLEQALVLNQRFARQRNVSLAVVRSIGEKRVKTSPFQMLQLLTALIECCLDSSERDSVVTMTLVDDGKDAGIELLVSPAKSAVNVGGTPAAYCDLDAVTAGVGASVEPLSGGRAGLMVKVRGR